jgi:hypothetical protein
MTEKSGELQSSKASGSIFLSRIFGSGRRLGQEIRGSYSRVENGGILKVIVAARLVS